jgi:purine-binding chemotaxis protein CheW
MLVCRIGTGLCAFPVRHVVEIMRPGSIEPLSGVPSFVVGVCVIRGAPVPVVDTGLLVRGERQETSRLVTIRVGAAMSGGPERVVALAVTEVIGLNLIAPASLAGLPPLLGDPRRLEIIKMGVLETEMLLVLDCARTVPESVWAALSGLGAEAGR